MQTQKFELIDPDVRLMLEVRDGNAAAFEKLVKKHQPRLILILSQLVANRSQAEDLAQEVFLRVFRARENYLPTAKFSTWLYTITHNVASNASRRLSRRKEVNMTPGSADSQPVRTLETMATEKSGLMPARVFDRQELASILHTAIQSLPPRQAMAMMLSRFQEMSYQEIADAMELTPKAVKSLLARGRSGLKSILEPYVEAGQLPLTSRGLPAEHDGESADE
jgi:RNA polymerase sigma-70 factor (ECF subfamily)